MNVSLSFPGSSKQLVQLNLHDYYDGHLSTGNCTLFLIKVDMIKKAFTLSENFMWVTS